MSLDSRKRRVAFAAAALAAAGAPTAFAQTAAGPEGN